MGYIATYLPYKISETQAKRVFVGISPTFINTTHSSRYLANIWWLFSAAFRKKVQLKFA